LQILNKKPVPSTVFVKHQLITPRNVDLIYPLDERRDFRAFRPAKSTPAYARSG
jgi:hypothetical protein